MSIRYLLLLLTINVLIFQCNSSRIFRNSNSWLINKSSTTDDEKTYTTVNNCLSLRGGASNEKEEDTKIKGTCIGIDLGTTYR